MVTAVVTLNDAARSRDVLRLRPGVNLATGERHFEEAFGPPSSLELDLLTVASAVFACDLAIKREERETITRSIDLTIPVTNRAVFERVRDDLVFALYRLSHDAWHIRFEQRPGTPEEHREWPETGRGKVLLFSGGLDSLAAAVRLAEAGEQIRLVSHFTGNTAVSGAQNELNDYLYLEFPGLFSRFRFRVGGRSQPSRGFPFPSDAQREETQRTRSFLFLALAGMVARRHAVRDVVMIAENGQLAIHLPLSSARISAFSTHTAHPEFIATIAPVLSRILGFDLRIVNPFLYETKAEVVQRLVPAHRPGVERAISCWKASRVPGAYRHCGFCIPCLVRRVAIEAHGVTLNEYRRDLLAERIALLDPDDDGKRNLVELGEFVTLFEKAASQAEVEDAFPDIVNPHFDAVKAAEMYRRFAGEARGVFDRYPNVRDVLR